MNCDFSNGLFLSNLFTNCKFIGCNLTMAKFNNSQLITSHIKNVNY
ncbi:pentapeptide repeat-containing protein [Lutibacter litoralis]|uniref:Pentapeptide repeat-containing protein n=1 Tax=Lutibacter litoralis TaxID=321268 RepID=A0ABV5JZG1_9FLAO|nr:pentapeptide repeat-containing protein [Gramella jeungdoensis]